MKVTHYNAKGADVKNIVELQGRRNAIDFDRVVSSISKDAKVLMGDPLMDPVQSKPGIRKSF